MSPSDWFGDLPSEWHAAPLGYYFDVVLGKMLNGTKTTGNATLAPYLAAGSIQPERLVLDESKTMGFTDEELAQYGLRKGDILVVEGGAGYGRSHLLAEDLHGWGFQNHVARLRARGQVQPGFLLYCLKACLASGFIEANNRTATLPSLSRDVLRALPIPIPPVPQQQDIVDYLDRETARIDTLVDEQQRLIEMLRERRKGTATSELGARVGLGERLKWYLEELDIRASEMSAVLPLMSVSIDWGVRRRDEVTADETRAADLSNYKLCRRGDLVINRMRAFQGALGLAPEEGIVSPDYAVLRPAPEIDGGWLAAAMKTDRFVSEMASRIKGIGSANLGSARTPRINVRDLCEIRLDIPEAEVQANEIGRLRRATEDIDTLIAETERFIELARERRLALITAAVTGQIDMSESAA